MSRQFQLFLRGRSTGKKIYYCEFYDEAGVRIKTVSTKQTSKIAARDWAIKQISNGLVNLNKDMKFSKYAENWFIWDKCSYIKRENERKGYRKSYAEEQRSQLVHNILPYFGKLKLSQITVQRIDDWLFKLRDEKSPVTANRCLSTFKIMMKEALRLQLIPVDPSIHVKKLREEPKDKGLLSPDEVKEIFDPKRIDEIWSGDLFYYAINILAATTGMRMGEVQGLKRKYVHKDYIQIEHSWDRKYGLVPPKAKSRRAVSIPGYVSDVLYRIIEQDKSMTDESVVFCGRLEGQPVDHRAIVKHLYRAFNKIGISPEIRRSRNVTFHSWRHFFNTFMRGKVSDAQLRKLTGHRTEAMTDHYDHQLLEELIEIRKIQNTILLQEKKEL